MENAVPEKPVRKAWFKQELMSRDAALIASTILLSAVIVSLAILMPSSPMQSGKGGMMPAEDAAPTDDAALPTEEDTAAVTTIDDDPILGDKTKAKVAIVEFSDFECPFCKRFHAETYDQVIKDYVTTGKAILVARDFPLSFHDPKATEEAAFAECVGAEKGDAAYFAFSKELYTNTLTNGKGLPEGKLNEIIRKVGANPTTVTTCSTGEAVKAEIQKDLADGQKAGISGTPSFVIGTLAADGTVTGERIVGALPYSGFQEVLDKYLQ